MSVLFYVISVVLSILGGDNSKALDIVLNNEPIVGILAQEQSYYLETIYPGQYKSYIAASYVKSVESAGARVVPIWIGQNKKYYEDIMSKINGVLIPGGATFFNQSNGYADAGEYIFNITKEMNNNGIYFPLWGTCLGFELLPYLDGGRIDFRADCSATDVAMPLYFTEDYLNSRLFKNAPQEVIYILATQDVTPNVHQYCITNEILQEYNLQNNWKVLSVNDDVNGLEFISTYEHFRYPIYGVQFHPEKNAFEWKRSKNISHTEQALKADRYFMDFFISEARKNKNSFETTKEETEFLIYNYQATYTGKIGSAYEQCYMFP